MFRLTESSGNNNQERRSKVPRKMRLSCNYFKEMSGLQSLAVPVRICLPDDNDTRPHLLMRSSIFEGKLYS